ncbi:MAG: flagellin [Armatimonadota bacterium]|nr:hypothetical protein [bacterium]
MGFSVNTNTTASSTYRYLSNTDSALSKSITNLSSGYKINTAADDPAGLVISEKLNAQVNGINTAITNASNAVNLVSTAEGALSEVSSLLSSIRDLAVSAANAGASDEETIAAYQTQIEDSLASIDKISQETQYGNKNLLDGSSGVRSSITGSSVSGSNLNNGGLNIGSITQAAEAATVTGDDLGVTEDTVALGGTATGGTLTIAGTNGTAVSITYTSTETVAALCTAVNAQTTVTGVTATYDTVSGSIVFATSEKGSNQSISIEDEGDATILGSATTTTDIGQNGLIDSDTLNITITQKAEQATVASGSFGTSATTATSLTTSGSFDLTGSTGATVTIDYDTSMTIGNLVDAVNAQTDTTGVTATYNTTTHAIDFTSEEYGSDQSIAVSDSTAGIMEGTSTSDTGVDVQAIVKNSSGELLSDVNWNSGNGLTLQDSNGNTIDLTEAAATATVTGTALADQLTVSDNSLTFQVGAKSGQTRSASIASLSTSNLGTGVVDGTSLADVDVSTVTGAANAIDIIDKAISQVSTIRANLGSLQTNTLETTTNSLTVASENLTSSVSTITDTDMATEITNMTKYQVLEQAGISMLSQANSTSQNMLSLLQ